ncbi:MAG: FAD-dependent oxidoreductase [Clostridiales bacterium]|nr:FAD-dependent oxidoreductase [Clostridiales bacterium]
MSSIFPTIDHDADLCVVGGGLAGLCAAVAAARHGARVVLAQDRPMLGGNASSEIRMWVCGARGKNMLETGLIEELMLENLYRNPDKNYSVWDSVMYELARNEQNIELLLNCSVNECSMDGDRILSVTGWQMTTQQFHRVRAKLFADCSGDSVLAPLSGAEYRFGRETEAEFGESLGRNIRPGDRKTMGMSCMLQAREEARPSDFIPPKWAAHFTEKDLPHRIPDLTSPLENFWYLELGGDGDPIGDTEKTRDELLKIAYGLWDFVKNDPSMREKNRNWRLDWVGILPGKRESRRYTGDYTLTQNDIEAAGRFEDTVAYGGWPMDDHDPRGFRNTDAPNVNYPAPSPYGIPYRCLYSKNIRNLLFAGRNISVTHWVLSSCRVMGTCALLGQAVGTAAAIAAREGCDPREVYISHLSELKQLLIEDDCYLPCDRRKVPELSANAALIGNDGVEALRNGLDRPVGENDNGYYCRPGEVIEYRFKEASEIRFARIIWDSELDRESMPRIGGRPFTHNMMCNKPAGFSAFHVPDAMVRAYRIDAVNEDGSVETLFSTDSNYQRLNRVPLSGRRTAVRLIPLKAWRSEIIHLFSFDVG